MNKEYVSTVIQQLEELQAQYRYWSLPEETEAAVDFSEHALEVIESVIEQLEDSFKNELKYIHDLLINYLAWQDGYDDDIIAPQDDEPFLGDSLIEANSRMGDFIIWLKDELDELD